MAIFFCKLNLEEAVLVSQRLEKILQYKFLIESINFLPTDAEQPENLNIFFFNKLFAFTWRIYKAIGQMLDYFLCDKIVNKEVIVLEQLLKQIELAVNIWGNHVI